MSSLTLHPSLDTDGWLETTIKVADAMLSHFFLSDYSQTSEFRGEVSSFSYILQLHQGDLPRIREVTQSTLSRYFSKQFTDVDVQVADIKNVESINKQQIGIYLVFTDGDGISHNLSRLINYSDMKINEIISVLNNG